MIHSHKAALRKPTKISTLS